MRDLHVSWLSTIHTRTVFTYDILKYRKQCCENGRRQDRVGHGFLCKKKRRERRREREVWERDWLQRRWGKGALRQLMAGLRLEDEERVTESICGWTPRHLWGKKFFPECYPKCFCCLDQVSYNGFNKKSRGTDIFGLCFVNMTSRELCCWKTIFRCLISACLHCLWQKNTLTLGST